MTKSGLIESIRRIIVLALLAYALASLPERGWGMSLSLIAAALVAYLAIPRAAPPSGALVFERMPAVVGPDLIGFLLTSVFIALPFWARMDDPDYWADFGIFVHPAAFLTWPLAAIAVSILIIAARNACFWVVLGSDSLRVGTARQVREISFEKIKHVEPYRRGLPAWLAWLAPLFVLIGKPGAAGAILVSRDATGMTLRIEDGSALTIAADAFEKPFARILKALHAHGVRIDAGLQRGVGET